ncbi:DUF4270 family protein [Coprobacter sp.]
MKLNWLLPFVLIVLTISCNDDINKIGTSIDDTLISIQVDNSFAYTTSDSVYSVTAGPVPNRTIIQMLGAIDMEDYGSLRADFLSQMRPIAKFDSRLVTEDMLDSLVLELGFLPSSFLGDSLTPMQVSVYPLNKVLEKPLFSNLDPQKYYSPEEIIGKQIYTTSRQSYPDSLINSDGSRIIKIKLARPGETSKKFAQEFFKLYNDKGGILTENDINEFFPGIYVTNTYGKGVLINILSSAIKIYHSTYVYNSDGGGGLEIEDEPDEDDIYPLVVKKTATSILVSSNEVPTINHITSTNASYIENAIANDRVIIKSPDGYDAHITFPVTEIIKKYRQEIPKEAEINGNVSGLINAVNFSIPVVKSANETFKNYGLTPPPYLLLMRAGGKVTDSDGSIIEMDKNKFFQERKLTDGQNYFYASYNSKTNAYDFGNIRGFITNIIQKNPNNGNLENGGYPIDSDLILVPVAISTSYNEYYGTIINAITPYISAPTFVELDAKNIKIELVYSKKTY